MSQIQGSMREAPLPDIIQLVSQGGKSGCFHVQQDARKAKIYLKDGKIAHAVTGTSEGLEAVYEVALWLDGNYRFEEPVQTPKVSITKPNPAILMELGRRMDEWRVISQKITSLDLYPASNMLPDELPAGVNPREAKILNYCTGWYTVAELAELLQKPVLNVAKDLYGLVMAGHVIMKGIRSGRPPQIETPASAPVATPLPPPAPQPQMPPPPPPVVAPPVVPAPPPVAPPPPKPEVAVALKSDIPPVRNAPQVLDPVAMAKLTAFTQRIAVEAKGALPPEYHEMVNKLQSRAAAQILSGEGPEAVKGLALAISRSVVDQGGDPEMVRNLNSRMKALFNKK